jgi:hypothetical protein
MNSEMQERVAKALAFSDGGDWDTMSEDPYSPRAISRPYWRIQARAAIEALRESMAEMIEDQRQVFDLLIACGYYAAAVRFVAEIMLGPDVAGKMPR